jgi:hypothetical protein
VDQSLVLRERSWRDSIVKLIGLGDSCRERLLKAWSKGCGRITGRKPQSMIDEPPAGTSIRVMSGRLVPS